jgi:DNA repair exonuclease SbcCD ATPase subunit
MNEAAATLAQSLRAAHAKQISDLSAKQSADLAKVREIARKTVEEVKRREAEAERRADALHEELCALKVALAEARDACAAAVGESAGAKKIARLTVLLGVGAACVARDELLAMGKAVVKKATQKVAAAKARAGP